MMNESMDENENYADWLKNKRSIMMVDADVKRKKLEIKLYDNLNEIMY